MGSFGGLDFGLRGGAPDCWKWRLSGVPGASAEVKGGARSPFAVFAGLLRYQYISLFFKTLFKGNKNMRQFGVAHEI